MRGHHVTESLQGAEDKILGMGKVMPHARPEIDAEQKNRAGESAQTLDQIIIE